MSKAFSLSPLIAVGLFSFAGVAVGAELRGQAEYQSKILPMLEHYCFDCHADGVAKGDFAFDEVADLTALFADLRLWDHVRQQVTTHVMPPENKDQPALDQRDALISWIDDNIFWVDPTHPDPGAITRRRLNRVEYQNTMRDLLFTQSRPADKFPLDDTGYGFDTIGDVLSISPMLMEKYLRAASELAQEAIFVTPPSQTIQTLEGRGFFTQNGSTSEQGPLRVYGSNAQAAVKFTPPTAGRYQIKLTVAAQQAGDELAKIRVQLNDQDQGVFEVSAVYTHDSTAWQTLTVEADLPKGESIASVAFTNDFYDPEHPDRSRRDRNFFLHSLVLQHLPGVLTPPQPSRFLGWVLQGETLPLNTPASNITDKDWVFDKNVTTPETAALLKKIPALTLRMASRLFRRPLTEAETEQWTKLVQNTLEQGETPIGALRLLLEGMMVSPAFLYHPTPQPGGDAIAGTELIDEFTLASRLAYFLWSAPPDDKLLQRASKNELRANLPQEIQRMIGDWRNRALTENFAGQWLQLRDLSHVGPEYEQFKDFYRVQNDLKRETETYFDHLIKENRPVIELLQSDYTFLNQRLSEFYSIPGAKGDQLEKVSLSGTQRGGILTHASLLTLTSNPTRTSPVKRGKFLLETILGTPPPPAPEGVPLLKEDEVHRSKLTLREQLAAHRENPSCAGCHAFLDPMGFAFENYDAIGRYRKEEKGQAIDASGKLVRGQPFKDLGELRSLLATDLADTFVRNLATNLLTYALGRGTTYMDRPTLDRIVERTRADGWRMQTLLQALCESAPFQRYRTQEAE